MSNFATSSALAQIRSLTDTSDPLFNYKKYDNIVDVKQILSNLNKADSREVISKLSDAELKQIARMMNDDSIFITVGLSQDQRNQFFTEMARDLDGPTLAKLCKAFDADATRRVTTGPGGRQISTWKAPEAGYPQLALDNIQALARAVSLQSPPDVQVAFVAQLAGKSTDQSFVAEFNGTIHEFDPQAMAIAQVIAGMGSTPAAAESALKKLKPAELAAVFQAAVQREQAPSYGVEMGATVPSLSNAKNLESILKVAANIKDPDTKALVFAEAAKQLEALTEDGRSADAAKVRQAMGKILLNDTDKVLGKLSTLMETRDGKALTTFAESCLKAGDLGTLSQLRDRLCAGGAQAYTDRFNKAEASPGGGAVYKNAETVGYFAGALAAALDRVTGRSAKENGGRADILGVAWKVLMSALEKGYKPGQVVGFGLAAMKDILPLILKSILGGASKQPGEEIIAAFDPVRQEGTRENGTPIYVLSGDSASKNAFLARLEAVVRSAN